MPRQTGRHRTIDESLQRRQRHSDESTSFLSLSSDFTEMELDTMRSKEHSTLAEVPHRPSAPRDVTSRSRRPRVESPPYREEYARRGRRRSHSRDRRTLSRDRRIRLHSRDRRTHSRDRRRSYTPERSSRQPRTARSPYRREGQYARERHRDHSPDRGTTDDRRRHRREYSTERRVRSRPRISPIREYSRRPSQRHLEYSDSPPSPERSVSYHPREVLSEIITQRSDTSREPSVIFGMLDAPSERSVEFNIGDQIQGLNAVFTTNANNGSWMTEKTTKPLEPKKRQTFLVPEVPPATIVVNPTVRNVPTQQVAAIQSSEQVAATTEAVATSSDDPVTSHMRQRPRKSKPSRRISPAVPANTSQPRRGRPRNVTRESASPAQGRNTSPLANTSQPRRGRPRNVNRESASPAQGRSTSPPANTSQQRRGRPRNVTRESASPAQGRSASPPANTSQQRRVGPRNVTRESASPAQGRSTSPPARGRPPPRLSTRKAPAQNAVPKEKPQYTNRLAIFAKEVRMLQRSTKHQIPALPFSRFVREIMMQFASNFRVTPDALGALHESAELYITHLLSDASLLAANRKQVTVQVKDMKLVLYLRNPYHT